MSNNKNVKNYNGEINIKEGIILVSILVLIVLIIYGLTLGAQKIGLFDQGYVKPELSAAVISYDSTLAGSMFDKSENEYYVMIVDFSSDESIYVSSLGSSYKNKENHLPIYLLDLSNHFNKNIIGETSNPTAQNVSEMRVSEPTLIFIKDGKNHRYVTGNDNIKAELGL